jgi:hypothetical protein
MTHHNQIKVLTTWFLTVYYPCTRSMLFPVQEWIQILGKITKLYNNTPAFLRNFVHIHDWIKFSFRDILKPRSISRGYQLVYYITIS